MKESESVITPDHYTTNIRTVGGKTFTLRDGIWWDTDYKDGSKFPTIEVKFGSDEFFKLIGDEPKLAEYFSLGQKVVVVHAGRVYKVS